MTTSDPVETERDPSQGPGAGAPGADPRPAADPLAAEAIPSPNIWTDPDLYEQENRGVDPDGALPAAMLAVLGRASFEGLDVVDIGCGTGFHLPWFAQTAASVTGVEPHPPLVARARSRVAGLPGVRVLEAGAASIPVPDNAFDVHHSRWAYFFGAGCEPGLAELARVMRPGATSFVIDNDASRSTFGAWFTRAWPDYDAVAVERFWRRQGWTRTPVDIRWDFPTREVFERVVRLEFAPAAADDIVRTHPGTGVDYAVNLWHRTW